MEWGSLNHLSCQKCIKNDYPRSLTTTLTADIHLQMQLTLCFFTLIIKTIKNNIFWFLENMSYISTQIFYKRRKSIIFVEKSYFEGLKCPINIETVLFKKSPILMKFSSGTTVYYQKGVSTTLPMP